jgi:hypothetical protein
MTSSLLADNLTPCLAMQVDAGSVSWLLDLGNYFQVPPLVTACCKVRRLGGGGGGGGGACRNWRVCLCMLAFAVPKQCAQQTRTHLFKHTYVSPRV